MPASITNPCGAPVWPRWVPVSARNYLSHTVGGQSLRALARQAGCHASTILRQVRQFEQRRDDTLVDQALTNLGEYATPTTKTESALMPAAPRTDDQTALLPTDPQMQTESARILRRLNEPGACLAVAAEMEKAVVVRDDATGQSIKTAVVDRAIVEAMALTDWIACRTPGRVARYHITSAGRAVLRQLLARAESAQQGQAVPANATPERQSTQGPDRAATAQRAHAAPRYSAVESPLQLLARRKNRDGTPFLSGDLVTAGERLREDFELAQLGPRVTQNWESFLTQGTTATPRQRATHEGRATAASTRVTVALRALGPGLGDVALRCCCFLEGMETAERRMGWSARSGKVVLRIALERLRDHYAAQNGAASMIG